MAQLEIILRGVDRASAVLKQVTDEATGSMERTAAAAEKAGERAESVWNRAGQAVGKAVATAAAAGGAALVGLAATAGSFATNFQADMANVGTLLGPGMESRVSELGANVKNLAKETGKPLGDLAGGLYQVVSAFGDGAESATILEKAAKASKAGLASTQDAVNLLSAVTKGYGDTSAAAVGKVSDLSFMTVKLGQTTFPELAASMAQAVPLASTVGVRMEELFGAMATLTGVTGGTAEVSTQLRATFQALVNPSSDMADALEKIGFTSGAAAVESLGFSGVLQALQKQTGGNTQQLAKMFGSVEALNAVLALTGPQAQNLADKTAAMGQAAGATDEAFKIQQQTVAGMRDRLKEVGEVLLVNLGEKFLPKLMEVGEWVTVHMPQIQAGIETAFNVVGRAIDGVVAVSNGLVAAWGFLRENADVILPAVAAAVVALGVVMAGQIAAMIAGWIAQAAAAATAAMATIAALLPIVGPILLVGAVVAGLALIWKKWGDDIIRIAGEVMAWLAGFFTQTWGAIVAGVQAVWTSITGFLSAAWNSILTTAAGIWESIKAFFAEWWETLLVIFTGPIGLLILLIVKNWETISQTTRQVWDAIAGFFTEWWDRLSSLVTGAVQRVTSFLSDAWSAISGTIQAVWGAVAGWFTTWWEGLVAIFKGPVERLISLLTGAWDSIKSTFTGAFTEMVDSALDFGRRIIESLRRGIGSVRIPLPSFGLSWSEGPLGIKIPSLNIGVNWRTLADLVPWLAEGGIATGPVIAGLGEAGDEAILPLDRLVPLLSRAMRQATPAGAGTVIQRLVVDMRGSHFADGRDAGRRLIGELEANGIRVQGV